MGHRELLLDAAKRCLSERGYARTTARDLVAASGTNLASIGYHFGSKEALLNAAMVQAFDDWGARLMESFERKPVHAADPVARFEKSWSRVIDAIQASRPLAIALFEALAQSEHSPEMRTFLVDAMQHGREQIAAADLERADAPANAARARTAGAFNQALLIGLMAQWLIDPERAPSGRDLGAALRAMLNEDPSAGHTDAAPRRKARGTRGARTPHRSRTTRRKRT